MLANASIHKKKMVDKNQTKKRIQKHKNNKNTNENTKEREIRKETKTARARQATKNPRKKQADDKSARIKKAKAIKKIFTWTILIAMLVGLFVFLCKSELFEICNIEITGNSQVSQEAILSLSEIKLQDNIFLSNIAKAKKKISQNSYIKQVEIKRVLPDKIKIEVIEKQKAYMLQIDENFAYIDKNGDILEIAGGKIENLITLQGCSTPKDNIVAGNSLNEQDIEKLEDIQKILKSGEKNEISDKISSINIKNKNEYILNLPVYKKIVYIGDTSNLATKMLRTKDIIDKTMEKEGKIFVNGDFNDGFDPYFREEANN